MADDVKRCLECRVALQRRRRTDGKLETNRAFAGRQFCSQQCGAVWRHRILEHGKYVRDELVCMACGADLVQREKEQAYAFIRRKYCDRECFRIGITYDFRRKA